jgi:NAD(P)-dependent dehydrogenase (short-subunit alcohol dehydrogenase family)
VSGPSSSASRVWFITGAAGGLGRAITAAALRRGDRVVAAARRPERLEGLVPAESAQSLAVPLDVTDPSQVKATVEASLARFGRLDVVVNNAGAAIFGAFEEVTEDQVRRLLEVNLFGAMHVTRAVLPQLRKQQSGHIIQMSSASGQDARPGVGTYATTKFALEGFSESLAKEVEPFGIKLTIVEPGRFRTNFSRSVEQAAQPLRAYAPTLSGPREALLAHLDDQRGDPDRAAQAILAVVDADRPPLRLPLGEDAFERIRSKVSRQEADWRLWEQTIVGTDYEEAC